MSDKITIKPTTENKEVAYRLISQLPYPSNEELLYVLVQLEFINPPKDRNHIGNDIPSWKGQEYLNEEGIIGYLEEISKAYRLNELNPRHEKDQLDKYLRLAINHYPITDIEDVNKIEQKRVEEVLHYTAEKNHWNVFELVTRIYNIQPAIILKKLPHLGNAEKIILDLLEKEKYMDAYFLYRLLEHHASPNKEEIKELKLNLKTRVLKEIVEIKTKKGNSNE